MITDNTKKQVITGRGKKFPLVFWTNIKTVENKNNKNGNRSVIEISCETDIEETTSTTEKEAVPVFKIRLIETDQLFLVAKPKSREVIIVKKPKKTDVFVSDPALAKKIVSELNKIKEKWAPSLWCTNPELTMVSALETMSKKKISGKIVPLIEKITKDFYGDGN